MSVLLEFNMIPTDQGESLSPLIARCMDVVERSGLPYKIGPMGTTIEGQTARDVLAVVERCLAELQEDCHRVEIGMSLDWRIEWEERAAIKEYHGGQSRQQAETEALRETIEKMNAVEK